MTTVLTAEQIISILITLFICGVTYFTHDARSKACVELSQEYKSNRMVLLLFFIVTSLLQYGSVGILIAIIFNRINIYIVFYLLVPLFLEGNRIILKNQNSYVGYFQLIKGLYYALMVGASVAQLIFDYSDPVNLLIGVSIALAIFDGIDAFESGIVKLIESKEA